MAGEVAGRSLDMRWSGNSCLTVCRADRESPYARSQTEADLIAREVRDGSTPDERGYRLRGPLPEVKQTKSGAKRTVGLECRLSAGKRSSFWCGD